MKQKNNKMLKKNNNIVNIDGKNYIKNIEAFKISNKWVHKDLVALDTFTNSLNLKSKLTNYIDLDGVENFSSKIINIFLKNKTIIMCESILSRYDKSFISHPYKPNTYIVLGERYEFPIQLRFTPRTKVYSVSESPEEKPIYLEVDNNLDFLKPYTFGIELETSGMSLKKGDATKLGFYELYDGSIVGPEYTSGIMTYKNLHYVDYFLNVLKTMSYHDHTCSLHIHIGNVDYTENNLCAIYSLFQRLQEDLNLLIAPYKKDYKFLYNKQKDHCQNLPLIPILNSENIKHLFKIPDNTDLNNYITETNKWNLSGRYYTVNFLNFVCKKQPNKTIELRSLQMTFNYDYFLTWLIINTAIIDYAVNNVKKVLDKKEKIQIEDVLSNFISNESILKNVINNYHELKNIIYSRKFLHNDTSTNSMGLDKNIVLNSIIPSMVENNEKIIKKLSNINIDSILIKRLNNIDLTTCVETNTLKVNLDGGYSIPNLSFCNDVLYCIHRAITKTFPKLDYDTNYIIPNNKIICNYNKIYIDKKVNNYCIIHQGILYYIVKYDNEVLITHTSIDHFKKLSDQLEVVDIRVNYNEESSLDFVEEE
jgi:hypothetical protein